MSAPTFTEHQRQPSARVGAAIAAALLHVDETTRAALLAPLEPVARLGVEAWIAQNTRGGAK